MLRDGRFTHTVTTPDGVSSPCDFVFASHSDSPVTLLASDRLPEYRLIGTWHAFQSRGNGSYFFVGIIIRRRWLFYFYNVIVPQFTLMTITIMSIAMNAVNRYDIPLPNLAQCQAMCL